MEQLRIRAERFRKQGRLRDKDLKEIIAEIKANDRAAEEDVDKTASSKSNKENRRVMEAVEEGLLQIHSTAPNTKQHGVFTAMALTIGSKAIPR